MDRRAEETNPPMTLEELRGKLGAAFQDPRRRQLAHIAVLDVAMAVGLALETKAMTRVEVEEATEALSAYLKGELENLPGDPSSQAVVADTLTQALQKISQEPPFASLFE